MGKHCNPLHPGCFNGNNLGRGTDSLRFCVSLSANQGAYHILGIKSKGTFAVSSQQHCCCGSHVTWRLLCRNTLWSVTLPITKTRNMDLMFLLSIHTSLSPLCIHVKWIKVLLHKLLTTLHQTVFLWPNSWFYFQMKNITMVPKCQMLWPTTAVLEISFKAVWTTYAFKT